ncbi:hypothetical protein VB776_19575 [Arcicella sp. DC2W]|uniref:Uncharacterized protein n=1 Tax=Arcicella gelida TaxID=2984195 RepID=A0ABU5S9J4_9BACT|nr:hypothetical protein [Arcicella sp. DC2W]MEA5405145.1 hypothetical protein [Arcicella sp. DC2W]
MIKIKYPNDKTAFEADYIGLFSITPEIQDKYVRINAHLNNHLPNSLEELLVAPIETLITSCFQIPRLPKHLQRYLKNFFQYDDFQNKISYFFIRNKNKINLKTCYYCNIDFINAFQDIGDYNDGLDFVKKASENELEKIKDIGTATIQKILAQRGLINSLQDLTLNNKQKINIENFVLKDEHSHFTLDHVLNKAKHPISALSLYNFVPCCYSCNSKFKGKKELINEVNEAILSPTYSNFSFHEHSSFKILLNSKVADFKGIKKNEDFVVVVEFLENADKYKKYLEVFKLKGRYKSHKHIALELINKSQDYSDTQIEEISKLVNRPVALIKSDIFGKNIFEGTLEDNPFTKYSRDIASNIGIKDVKLID